MTRSITIIGALTVTTSSLPLGVANAAYPATLLNAAGGKPPYTWSATGLPLGMNLNAATGQITGTPSASGRFAPQITVTDSGVPTSQTAKASLALTILDPLTIGNGPPPAAFVGSPYRGAATASGGTPPYTWSATGLPPGFSITPATGIITGTPVAPGTLSFTLTVKDSTPGGGLSASASRAIVVSPRLGITTTSLPAVVAGSAYTAVLSAAGGTKPYSWSATGLPSGLSIDPATGTVTGVVSTAGTATVVFTVKDAASPTRNVDTASLSLTVVAAAGITSSTLPLGVVGQSYSATLQGTGGTPPYVWSATGLPAGLGINASGNITGTPTAGGTSIVSITLKDSTVPPQTTTAKINLRVIAPPSIKPDSLPGGAVAIAYTSQLSATGGTPPFTWSATGLPNGLGWIKHPG